MFAMELLCMLCFVEGHSRAPRRTGINLVLVLWEHVVCDAHVLGIVAGVQTPADDGSLGPDVPHAMCHDVVRQV